MGWIWIDSLHENYIKSILDNVLNLYESGITNIIISYIEFRDHDLLIIETPANGNKIELASDFLLSQYFNEIIESIENRIREIAGECRWENEIPLDPSFGKYVCRDNIVAGDYSSIKNETSYEFKSLNEILTQLNRI